MPFQRPASLFPLELYFTSFESIFHVILGEPIRWESQVRLRNLVTRKYVSVESNGTFNLTKDGKDPRTVWRITPVIRDEVYVMTDSYARFEHVVSGMWLHALPSKLNKPGRAQVEVTNKTQNIHTGPFVAKF